MKVAVVVFPGTNCEHDVAHALRPLGAEPDLVWHQERDLRRYDGVVLPGGFAHGDYLRTGAIARFSPIMESVAQLAHLGRPIIGICNGFQILCEAGLLPGALIENAQLRFICRPVHVRVTSTRSVLTRSTQVGQVLQLPINSYVGNFMTPDLDELMRQDQIALQYGSPEGTISTRANPNGSQANIAAVSNPAGNVVGIMPHPERASEAILGSQDGSVLLESFIASLARA